MTITLRELVGKIGATLARGSADQRIRGVASLKEAGPDQIAPFFDKKFADELERTRAGVVLAKDSSLPNLPVTAALICAPDPEMAWVQTLTLLHPETLETSGVDSRAVIEPGVEIGVGVHIGPYTVLRQGAQIGARSVISSHCVIGRNCVIGENCVLHPHVTMYDGVRIGNRVIIHAGVVLGADGFGYKFRNLRYVKVPQVGWVEIGDDVEIGANSCIDRGTMGATRIGQGTKIDNLVQIAHNVKIGNCCILCGQSGVAGSAGMDDYAMLGGNAGIANHIFMGKGSKAGGKAGVIQDVSPGKEVWGTFADERHAAFKQIAATRRLPELLNRVRALEKELKNLRNRSPQSHREHRDENE
ncbi:MAG: UDP-3-O-(3-hydroxymyristoyl)glucosamine N-acyltransferase [Planctomycetota bacterium]